MGIWRLPKRKFLATFTNKCITYLQWVSIFLVVCAILFYTPRAIWLMAEGGLMKYLAKGATTKIVEDADKKREALLKTFQVKKIKILISSHVQHT